MAAAEPAREADDTRPVTRDWLLGAPERRRGRPAGPTPTPPASCRDDVRPRPAAEPAAEPHPTRTTSARRSSTSPSPHRSRRPSPVPSRRHAAVPVRSPRAAPPTGATRPAHPRRAHQDRRVGLPPAPGRRAARPARAAPGGGARPCSSRPPPSRCSPRPTASIWRSRRATSRGPRSSPGWTSAGCPPPRRPPRSRTNWRPWSPPTAPSSPTTSRRPSPPSPRGSRSTWTARVDAADDQPLNPWTRLVTLFDEREVTPVLAGEDTALAAQIENIAAQVDRAPVDATITFEGTTPSVVDAADGRALDQDGATDAITEALVAGQDPETPIELPVEITPVRVDRDEAERVLEETVRPAVSAPVAVVSQDGATSAEVPVAAIAASMAFTPRRTASSRSRSTRPRCRPRWATSCRRSAPRPRTPASRSRAPRSASSRPWTARAWTRRSSPSSCCPCSPLPRRGR